MRRLGSFLILILLAPVTLLAQDTLPGTTRWDFPADIAAEQYAELRTFYEGQYARPHAPLSGEAARAKLHELIGAVDVYTLGPVDVRRIGETGGIGVSIVEWPIAPIGAVGVPNLLVRQYGVLLEPRAAANRGPAMIAIGDAGASNAETSFGWQLARAGHIVYLPLFTERRAFSQPWLDDRQWLMRLAYQTGRHVIGSEVLQTMLARRWLAGREDVSTVGIWGEGQGGLTALLAGALDGQFATVTAEGFLDTPQQEWDQPEDRTVWGWRGYFTNADLCGLVGARLQPRPIVSRAPVRMLRIDPLVLARIASHQFAQWQAFYRNKAIQATRVRATAWTPDYSSADAYERSIVAKRAAYLDMIGQYPTPTEPPMVRSVLVYDEPEFRGWRLSVGVYDGVHAYGILLVPKSIAPNENRPVVFVAHGLGGMPEDALGVVPSESADASYQRLGWKLARRGYVVFAPMIATQDNIERTRLVRRSHPVGMIPAGMDARKFARVLDFLSTLDFVDKDRAAIYGLSYGGYTALWTAPAEPRFKVVIVNGHYNDWTAKTTDITIPTSFLAHTDVLDQYNFGMLNRINHSDLASLIAPRALMIEMGDEDDVVVDPSDLVAAEIARALDVWRRLGLPSKGVVTRFAGPHRIDGTDAIPFLDRWLNWTPRVE